MSDRAAPWQRGEPNPVETKAVPTATVIERGDLIATKAASDPGDPYSAADQAWDTDLATTQTAFALRFLGVALDRSRSGDVDPIRANTSGVHKFSCASAAWELGALVGPAKQSGNLLENQKVASVATEALAIGRIAKRYGSAVTEVEVEVFSRLMKGPTA